MVLVLVSILLEVVVIFLLLHYLGSKAGWVYSVIHILSIILVLVIYGSHKTASIKMTWIMLIMLLPIVGTVLFLIIGLNWHTLQMRKRYMELDKILLPLLPPNKEVSQHVRERSGRLAGVSGYLKKNAGYPVYENTRVTYYDDALKGLNAQLEELAKAERFIFMEYHAIEDAESWHQIQKVLVERARAGVEVRIFYDDMGSIGFINIRFLEGYGDPSRRRRCAEPDRYFPGDVERHQQIRCGRHGFQAVPYFPAFSGRTGICPALCGFPHGRHCCR